MLPQGVFSVAISTVLFPTLSRQAARRDLAGMRRTVANGIRQITLLLIPSAGGMMVLATPIARLVFQRGQFRALDPSDLDGAVLVCVQPSIRGGEPLLTRTFFALQRPWIPTGLAAINMMVDIVLSIGLYKPLGIAGLVIGTAAANTVMTGLLWPAADRLQRGARGPQKLMITVRVLLASARDGGGRVARLEGS